MRTLLALFICGSIAVFAAGQTPDAGPLVAAARQALGGEDALNAITSFKVEGTLVRQLSRQVNERLAIVCVLPDRFLRTSFQQMDGPFSNYQIETNDGFDGAMPIFAQVFPSQLPTPPPPPSRTPAPTTPEEIAAAQLKRINGQRTRFIEMGSSLFVSLPAVYGLQLTPGGKTRTAPEQADVIEMKRADGKTWQLLLDGTTHRPLKLMWRAKPIVTYTSSGTMAMRPGDPSSARGVAMPPPPPSGDPAAGLADVDWELTFGDYRASNGLTWPHRFTTAFDGKTWEDVHLGDFKINPKIDPKIFERFR